MAIIEAKYNDTPYVWNPLDPNCWEGGVVPGRNDTARFRRGGTVYASYEYDYKLAPNYNIGPNGSDSKTILPSDFKPTYRHPIWTRIASQLTGLHNARTGSTLGTARQYGGKIDDPRSDYNMPGIWTSAWSYNTSFGSSGSYNLISQNDWNHAYSDNFQFLQNNELPNRYFIHARTYYVWYNSGRASTKFTIDGVKTEETDPNDLYDAGNRRTGESKAEFITRTGKYPIADRMVDLFTGSALHVSNGGKYHIVGPHESRWPGSSYYTSTYLNKIASFTIFTTTGSEYRNSGASSSPSFTSTYYPNDNLYMSDYSPYLRAKHAFGIAGVDGFKSGTLSETGHIVSPTKNLINEEHPGLLQDEPTGSIKYGTPGISANKGYAWPYISGSGHFYLKLHNMFYTGLGPGNPDIVRMKFEDMLYYQHAKNVQVDTDHGTWSSSSILDYPMWTPIGGANGHGIGNIANGNAQYNTPWYSDNLLQRWELTGSQEWEVGRIEMGTMSHFHVKDNSKIKLYDINSGTATPSIDFQDYGIYGTLLITDSAEIEITSSRTSQIPWSTYGPESGIYMRRDSISLIVSGAANYSSSTVSSPAKEKDATIQIANASSTFGVGDYITIQSTGSLRIHSINQDHGAKYVSETDKSTWLTASLDTGSLINQRPIYSHQYRPANPGAGAAANNDSNLSNGKREFTHTMETDEIVQIMSMSADTVTVGKMYGKEGEIQSDMGLFTQNTFAETFEEQSDTIYNGLKRVVLVDSSHRNFKTGETLIISGSAYKILNATTYLSQSNFYEFTSSNQPPLEDVFDLESAMYSGSSIWPVGSNTYGKGASPGTYVLEQFKKERLLITGSYRGSNFYQDDFQTNNGYYAVYTSNRTLGGKSGSNTNPATGETHRALQLDATQGYTWQNPYFPWINNTSYAYRYNNLNGGNVWGQYQIKDTDNWEEGEILISGSILRNGFFDNSGSHTDGGAGQTGFGVTWGDTPYAGPGRHRSWYAYDGKDHDGYIYPNPRNARISITREYGGQIIRANGTQYQSNALSFSPEYSGSVVRSYYLNSAQPKRYPARRFYPSIHSDITYTSSSIDLFPAVNNYTASWHIVSASMISQHGDRTGGSCHIKVVKQEGAVDYYLGGSNGKEFLVDRFINNRFRGRISLFLRDFGSIYSVNIKTRWQQLILDTSDSFKYRDKIKEGGLLENHYAGKESKFIATEVVDAKGFKNLLWDYAYKKGDTNILPYMFGVCGTGTTAGSTANAYNSPWNVMTSAYNSHQVLHPKSSGANTYWTYGQSNANYYVIFDFRTQVEFDTVGVIHCKDAHQRETDAQNKMNDVQFEVCDDVGVASPAWETVVAEYDDTRQSGGQGDIRFYTFPSGSVNKRFIKWKNRGGTSSTNYRYFQHFGIYNFSGSCADTLTPAPNEDYTDVYGGPSASLCQVELANVKNFSVGDYIMFWSKQMYHTPIHSPTYNITTQGYKNVNGLSGYFDKTTPEEGVLGGFHQTHKITAISGNVVTLNKPITHCHIGAGTMAYKYNRGKVKFIGDRATPFFIYNYSVPSNYMHLSNVTFINGSPTAYQVAGAQNTHRVLEDVGMGLNQMNYQYAAKQGLMRNIVSTNINLDVYGSTSVDNFAQILFFNIFNVYKNSDYAGFVDLRHQRNVFKFNVDISKSYGGIKVLANSSYGGRVQSGTAHISDNFVVSEYRGDLSMTGGVTIDRGNSTQVDLSNQLVVKRNVSPLGYAPDFVSTATEMATLGAFADRGILDLGDPEHITCNSFFNPNYVNPRFREAHSTGTSAITNIGTTSKALSFAFGRHPSLIYASQKSLFGRRNYILTGDYYNMIAGVKSINFSNDKLFEFYHIGDQYPNYDQTSNSSCTPIFCKFFVKEDNTELRIDLEFIYKTMMQRVYGAELGNYTNRGWNVPGESVCFIGLEENESKSFIGEPIYLNSTQLKDISSSKTYTLNKGSYNFYIRIRTGYYMPTGNVMFAVKNMNLTIATNNINNIDVTYSNWDMLKLFDNVKHYSSLNNQGFTSNSGRNRVLYQTTDLTKKLKFNKIKL